MSEGSPETTNRGRYNRSAGHLDVLEAIFKTVKDTLPSLFTSTFTRIDEMLFDRADNARNLNEQRTYYDAMRLLRAHRDGISEKSLSAYFQLYQAILKNDLSL